MQTFLKVTAAAVLLATGACASKPAPVAETPPVETAPVVKEEVKVVETTPVETSTIAPGSLEDFRVNVGERVYFDLDQYRLDSDDQDILKRQAAWLASYPNVRILVAGNCDERGTREYNLALGERRANAVKEYLVSLGVSASRVDTVSYGKERPVVAGSNDQSWALNRNGWTQVVSGATS
ncbi:MAG: peptidoglycan-associated lipoprotein Pal [Hyphomonas sp.]|uniref:peptidoglycan-associated lipoprotein Pal n=1 Tax=Hyphomonas sp. TaxID=87 RepID=UPI0017AA890E|nr:peptidoglycan-associated lipoprotein Pal [Hyphomonas sp.]MBA3069042.1 peptidoglycan-associated lipoprotein Pal [Hyphomonas sp.]MBU3922215.1 peptidoglycan-associated lipoprotein Pal [Alphaproteobacteria bacterium]MBU4061675.1 peptidoglycan-associated lipoprotein Pal [Alphaproteobacteria bacterium]MBU4163520.1 peptidoglycan-associated lipoprotein Pal [Alphaproteobacteria bacterium]